MAEASPFPSRSRSATPGPMFERGKVTDDEERYAELYRRYAAVVAERDKLVEADRIYTRLVAHCDGGCGSSIGVSAYGNVEAILREDMIESGWVERDGKQLCPRCR